MKRPYYNRNLRIEIYNRTFMGSQLLLNLAIKKLLREVRKTDGLIAMKIAEKEIKKLLNIALLGITKD